MLKTIIADSCAERQFIQELKDRGAETDRRITEQVAAILEDADYQHYNELLVRFQGALDEFNQYARSDGQISIARGIALYEEETDLTFGDVFKRADESMYQNKAIMKRQNAKVKVTDRV